ncbi:MAG: phosphopyruvate hydratase [Candidatus Nanopelagicaceae bacterium]|uniref:phosphopyruvate hydratase n=1 Tax=Candidatus Planktophila sp. TaxID=2175601 RepID=UPI00275BD1D0|nr:phosphopyruvate hydratase [Candidatus Nanopelagicaceae bacterium]
MKIKKVFGYQVLDSRGRPTVAAAISLDDGTTHTARVPSGASTGKHEAMELRDENLPGADRFYGGKSVTQAVANINSLIAPTLLGTDISLADIDAQLVNLDPSENHMKLGANATLAVSLAAAIAEAHSQSKSLARFFSGAGDLEIPMPMVNILSGGAHAGRTLDIQDVLVLPNGASSFTESLSWIVAIREAAAKIGAAEGKVTHLIADEGGLGIAFASVAQACDFVVKVISSVGLNPGTDVSLALDIASTQFFDGSKYNLKTEGLSLTSADFVQYINRLVSSQPIVSIEDPFAEDDWAAWQEFMAIAPAKLQVLGDDLLTTNLGRLNKAIAENSANAILIKANQNGLVTSTLNVLKQARANNFKTVVSARSGETEDSWLADLATGWRAGQIKVGSTHGAERTAKWNRLLELEATEPSTFSNPFA